MFIRSKAALAFAIPVLAIGLGACGDDEETTSSAASTPAAPAGEATGDVTVYSSLPLQGASKDQTNAMVDGIKLAVKQAGGKAGGINVKYESLDDSTAQAGNWDPNQVASNARKVAQDKSAVAYIGEFNSGASALSIPILNQVGIAQISPANTYVGLTTDEPGSEKGEPEKYQPTGKKTYARIVPRDTIQAQALVTQMQADGCQAVAVANDKDTYGQGLARLFEIKAKEAGLKITANEGIQKDSANFRSVAGKFKSAGSDCFLFAGVTANGAVQIYKDVAAALPEAKLYGADGVCESGFTSAEKGGIPKKVAANFACTVATLDLPSYPGGKEFIEAFSAEYGDDSPDPYAIYGYEAMQLALDTIEAAGEAGTTREGVLEQLFQTKDRDSVLGTYSIDENGDTTLTDYGLYKVNDKGDPEYAST
ncbi:MAG: branched-chain amino acid ABC transporter substrate-binding protein, partial [Solirubrobacterales bacterium]|nr:branched-chain amino acid ABC transporter substrate-binding protein [Solirubrobacterales bacterium]